MSVHSWGPNTPLPPASPCHSPPAHLPRPTTRGAATGAEAALLSSISCSAAQTHGTRVTSSPEGQQGASTLHPVSVPGQGPSTRPHRGLGPSSSLGAVPASEHKEGEGRESGWHRSQHQWDPLSTEQSQFRHSVPSDPLGTPPPATQLS